MKTIFILENRRTIRRMVEIALQHLPVQLSFFDQSSEVEYGSHCHLILCDESLQEGDYQSVLIALRQKQIYAPAIILCQKHSLVKANEELTVVSTITKPFLTQNLVEKVCQALQISIPDQEVFKELNRRIPLKNGGYFEVNSNPVLESSMATPPTPPAPPAPPTLNSHSQNHIELSDSSIQIPEYESSSPQNVSDSPTPPTPKKTQASDTRTQFGFFAIKDTPKPSKGQSHPAVLAENQQRATQAMMAHEEDVILTSTSLKSDSNDYISSSANYINQDQSNGDFEAKTSFGYVAAEPSPVSPVPIQDSTPSEDQQANSYTVDHMADDDFEAKTSLGYVPAEQVPVLPSDPPQVEHKQNSSNEEYEAKTSFGYVPAEQVPVVPSNPPQIDQVTNDSSDDFEAKTSFGYVSDGSVSSLNSIEINKNSTQESSLEDEADHTSFGYVQADQMAIMPSTQQEDQIEEFEAKTSFGYVASSEPMKVTEEQVTQVPQNLNPYEDYQLDTSQQESPRDYELSMPPPIPEPEILDSHEDLPQVSNTIEQDPISPREHEESPSIVPADVAFGSDISSDVLADSIVPADVAFASEDISPQAPEGDLTDTSELIPSLQPILQRSAQLILQQSSKALAQKLPYVDMSNADIQDLLLRSIWEILPTITEKVIQQELQKSLLDIKDS